MSSVWLSQAPASGRRLGKLRQTHFGDLDLYTCGFWCQGPVLLQTLNILTGFDLASLGHNSRDYIHIVAEALKLAFADRHHHYGDPRFIDVPSK